MNNTVTSDPAYQAEQEKIQLMGRVYRDRASKEELASLAKKSCKKCYGRGHLGVQFGKDHLISCSCARKTIRAYAVKATTPKP